MIVVDAAAVVDALSGLASADDLRALLANEELSAPTLLDYEVVSAFRGLTLRGELTATRAEDALTDFEAMPINRWPFADALRRRAFQLRHNVSAYDAAYVVLAEALDCPLVTRDALLAKAARQLVRIELR